jgi:hypothetical protein
VHGSALGGHSGFPVTYKKLKQLVAWKGMKAATHTFVQSCVICQQAKPNRSKYSGLLEPLPVPNGAWEVVSMDFIEGLPRSGSANCIMVAVDNFSKYNHFLPLLHPFTAATVAEAFLNNVYKLHGMPAAIISDRDKVLTSRFWQEFFKLAKVTLQMSSSYHPQTERVNQCLKTYLHCFVLVPSNGLSGWPLLNFGTTQVTIQLWVIPLSKCCILKSQDILSALIKQHLLRAQDRMKQQADKKRSDITFSMGDRVFLKLQPYVQSSLATGANKKLAFKCFGPYTILERIRAVAYKLDLLAESAIHPVFHISQLKKCKHCSCVIYSP